MGQGPNAMVDASVMPVISTHPVSTAGAGLMSRGAHRMGTDKMHTRRVWPRPPARRRPCGTPRPAEPANPRLSLLKTSYRTESLVFPLNAGYFLRHANDRLSPPRHSP